MSIASSPGTEHVTVEPDELDSYAAAAAARADELATLAAVSPWVELAPAAPRLGLIGAPLLVAALHARERHHHQQGVLAERYRRAAAAAADNAAEYRATDESAASAFG